MKYTRMGCCFINVSDYMSDFPLYITGSNRGEGMLPGITCLKLSFFFHSPLVSVEWNISLEVMLSFMCLCLSVMLVNMCK